MKHGLASAYLRRFGRARTIRAILARALAVLAAAFGLLGSCGCSSSSRCGHGPQCGQGTACIDDGSGAGPSCKKTCTKQTDCPLNTFCNDAVADGLPVNFCAASTYPVIKQAGQWGDPCVPVAACDALDSFECFGTSPADANAFCTIYDCTLDSDCPGGWWCAAVDSAPNFTTQKRSFGRTNARSVCLPRRYCDPCRMDHDCPRAADGTWQHCVPDANQKGFCAPQCTTSDNCPTGDSVCTTQWGACVQAGCANSGDCQTSGSSETCLAGVCQRACKRDADCPPSNGVAQHCTAEGLCSPPTCASDDDCPPTATRYRHCNAGVCAPECAADTDCNPGANDQRCVPLAVCTPRAGACVGDGSFCMPCRSDTDCANGYCLVSKYSKERFCSQTVAGMQGCSPTTGVPLGGCPARPSSANYKGVACTIVSDDFSLSNQCVGEVTLGTNNQGQPQLVPGCWTTNR